MSGASLAYAWVDLLDWMLVYSTRKDIKSADLKATHSVQEMVPSMVVHLVK